MTRFACALLLIGSIAASPALAFDDADVLKLRGQRSSILAHIGIDRYPIPANTKAMVKTTVESYGFAAYALEATLTGFIENKYANGKVFFLMRPEARPSTGNWALGGTNSVVCLTPPNTPGTGEDHVAFLVVADSTVATPAWTSNTHQNCE